ncbi:MAG: NAD(P)H-hydrate dehydratase [Thermodesulfobacteriota bacterium]
MKAVTAYQMRALDRRTIHERGVPGINLMENAGKGATEVILRRFPDLPRKRVAVIAGKGNNGGDAFVIARHLINKGLGVNIFLLAENKAVKGDAKTNLDILTKEGIEVRELPTLREFEATRDDLLSHDVFIEGLLGTGLDSEVKGYYKEVISALNATGKPVVAIDIPSGLDATSGKPLGTCIKAALTPTFGLPKVGQLIHPGVDFVGELEVIDIGIPDDLIEEEDIRSHLIQYEDIQDLLPVPRHADTHKGDYGHLLVLAGSVGKTGAAALACQAAMRVGAGLVTLGIPASLNEIMEVKLTETMTMPLPETESRTLGLDAFRQIVEISQGMQALVIGPGISTADETGQLVRKLVKALRLPMVIDADALTALSAEPEILKDIESPIILTPHPGEMARLTGLSSKAIQEDRIEISRNFAMEYGVYLVLKGSRTIIAQPGGDIHINPSGNPGMASGGTGDVLTGMMGGLVCQGCPPASAAIAATYVHGLAGDLAADERGEMALIATDLLEKIPHVLREMNKGK